MNKPKLNNKPNLINKPKLIKKPKLNNKPKLNKTKLKTSSSLFTIILTIILIIIMLIPSCKDNKNNDNKNKINEKTTKIINHDHIIYTCPMHPDIKQDKPGDCPICNMKLVPVKDSNKQIQTENSTPLPLNDTTKNSKTQKIIYTCPMHPNIKQDKPGDCPICGMKLVPIKDSDSNSHSHDNTNSIQNKDKHTLINSTTTEIDHSHNLQEHSHNIIDNKPKLSFDNTIKVDYNIKLYKVKHLTLKNELKFNGYTAINESSKKSLSLNTDAWIKDTYNLFEGKYIKKGEPILKIYSLEIE
ncbi:MAG: heavy metal-binding domain-containing protein [bacterium]